MDASKSEFGISKISSIPKNYEESQDLSLNSFFVQQNIPKEEEKNMAPKNSSTLEKIQ